MLKDNLIILRKYKGISQEEIAEIIGISRQAYGKWEKGETIPDIEKCDNLAKFYGITVDDLLHFETHQSGMIIPPGPSGKHICGTTAINERGQIVIPKKARDLLKLQKGDNFVVLVDEAEGLALVKAEVFEGKLEDIRNMAHANNEGDK